MENDGARNLARLVESAYGLALLVLAGISARCEYHADCGVIGPLGFHLVQIAVGARGQDRDYVALQSRQYDLGLGIAKTHVELQHPRPRVGNHEPAIQHAAILAIFLSKPVDGGLEDLFFDDLRQLVGNDRRG